METPKPITTFPAKISGQKRLISDTNSLKNYPWMRKVSAIKTKPSTSDKIKKTPFPKTEQITTNSNNGENFGIEREKIQEKLRIFREKYEELYRVSYKERGTHRIDTQAMKQLQKQGIITKSSEKITGSIPGVKIGDTFNYRVELIIVGLHSRHQNGIDFVKSKGELIATCIVSCEGYNDKMNGNEVLSYVGEGGLYGGKEGECPKDQKMEKGNLALKNSWKFGNDVRVVKGVKNGDSGSRSRIRYVYDGLYKVVDCKAMRHLESLNLMFEFKLKRNPNQPIVPWHRLVSIEWTDELSWSF